MAQFVNISGVGQQVTSTELIGVGTIQPNGTVTVTAAADITALAAMTTVWQAVAGAFSAQTLPVAAGVIVTGSDSKTYLSLSSTSNNPVGDTSGAWQLLTPAPAATPLINITTANLAAQAAALGVGGSVAITSPDSSLTIGGTSSSPTLKVTPGAFAATLQPSGDTTGATDTARVQAAFTAANTAGGGRVRLAAGAWTFSGSPTLCIYSNTWLDVDTGVVATLLASSGGQLLRNRASGVLGDGSSFGTTGISVAANSTTVTASNTAGNFNDHFQAFTGSKACIVRDAAGVPLVTTTATYVSATQITLATACPTAITAGGYVEIGPRDTNIKITGGQWVRTNGATSSSTGNGIMLFRVDKLRGGDIDLASTGGFYMFQIGDVTDVEMGPFRLATSRDGVHLNGPADNVRIHGVSGSCGDDVIPIIPAEGLAAAPSVGAVTNVTYRDVIATSTTSIATLWPGLVQGALTGSEVMVDNVTYDNVRPAGTATNLINVLMGGAYALSVGTLRLRGCAGQIGVAGNGETGTVDRIIVEDHLFPTMPANQPVLKIKSAVTVNELDALRWRGNTTSSDGSTVNDTIRFDDTAHGGLVTVDTCNVTGANLVIAASSSSIGTVKVAKSKLTGANAYALGPVQYSTSGTIGKVFLDGVETTGYAAGIIPAGCAVHVHGFDASGCTAQGLNCQAGVVVRGPGYVGPAHSMSGTTSTVYGADHPVDVSTLAKTAGQLCTNTNAGLSCGAGLVAADGTHWHNLTSGSTY